MRMFLDMYVARNLLLLASLPVVLSAIPAVASPKAQIMIVGVSHLVSAADSNNSKKFDPLSPKRQAEIADAMEHLARFKPTKVMVEAPYGLAKFQERYSAYLGGSYVLGPNEVYQYGFRLAKMAGAPSIYPIDMQQGFPFDFDAVKASARKNGQSAVLSAADAATRPLFARENDVAYSGTILETLRLLNLPQNLQTDAGWYAYIDGVGSGSDYAGADLVSFWYARNLHIFANIRRSIDSPNDRVVVFMGAGHAHLLRSFVELSPDLEFVDPEPYLQ
ncbi:MAG: DUF5694 domain-containing protein [Candidatus Baltobacteraceae bacterium]